MPKKIKNNFYFFFFTWPTVTSHELSWQKDDLFNYFCFNMGTVSFLFLKSELLIF